MLSGVVYFVHYEFGMPGSIIQPLTACIVSVIVIILGMTLTAISSYFSVGRYLRMNINDMYFV
jgi:cell division transport system permease protein